MTLLRLEGTHGDWRADREAAVDISIPLDFHGSQPVHFGAAPARAWPMVAGDFIGNTGKGGSCNAEVIELNPHCNGTHTETVAHVTDAPLAPRALATAILRAAVVTVQPEHAQRSSDTTTPPTVPGDRLITRAALASVLKRWLDDDVEALVIRTLPNDTGKLSRVYDNAASVPYFSREAMRLIVGAGIDHLLVDTPSVDRLHDDGVLCTHRLFWGLPPGSRTLGDAARAGATITEMIYVPDTLADGHYLLSLQVAPFVSDAVPSRPLLFPRVGQ